MYRSFTSSEILAKLAEFNVDSDDEGGGIGDENCAQIDATDKLEEILAEGELWEINMRYYRLAETMTHLVFWMLDNRRDGAEKKRAACRIFQWYMCIMNNMGEGGSKIQFDNEFNVNDKFDSYSFCVVTLMRWDKHAEKPSDPWFTFYIVALNCAVKWLTNVCVKHLPNRLSDLNRPDAEPEEKWNHVLMVLQTEKEETFKHFLWYLSTQEALFLDVFKGAHVPRDPVTDEIDFVALFGSIGSIGSISEICRNALKTFFCRVDDHINHVDEVNQKNIPSFPPMGDRRHSI